LVTDGDAFITEPWVGYAKTLSHGIFSSTLELKGHPMTTRRTFLALTAATFGAMALPAAAAKPNVYMADGIAINGFDTVAYFTQSDAVEGNAKFTADWDGASWHFASAENRDTFLENPEKYAPQFGGYCAYAVSKGSTASTSPDAWTVYEDKLYLNYNRAVRAIWKRNIPENIAKAEMNWPNVLSN
jgi:YHS domain-containing protein